MRRYWLLFLVGVAIAGAGTGIATYYALVVWPTITATFGSGCPQFGPCGPPPVPLWFRGPMLLGEAFVVLGIGFLAASAVSRAKAGPVPRGLRSLPACLVLAGAVGLLTLAFVGDHPGPNPSLGVLILGGLLALLGVLWLGSLFWSVRPRPT